MVYVHTYVKLLHKYKVRQDTFRLVMNFLNLKHSRANVFVGAVDVIAPIFNSVLKMLCNPNNFSKVIEAVRGLTSVAAENSHTKFWSEMMTLTSEKI